MQAARAAGLCLVVLALAATGFAQTQITTGVIQGTVYDQSGAVLQGAGVEAKNPDTNFTASQNTDAGGRFIFLALQPGRYTLTISLRLFHQRAGESEPDGRAGHQPDFQPEGLGDGGTHRGDGNAPSGHHGQRIRHHPEPDHSEQHPHPWQEI